MRKIFFVLFILVALGCADQYSRLTPKQVVETYYVSFAARDYPTMYALISDGFKEIEPTATSYDKFEVEMARFYDNADQIELKSVQEPIIGGDSATVNYVIEVKLKNGLVRSFDSSFLLKKKNNGWKLIHPYGRNTDTS